ncbi:MAG: hypothetical protein BAA04_12050 [Firmicutes bacterium ZCTH02-B6]|nr:MAG: hypothetical protein BAA04_12050 [Firmicutes bacterium ZCTH02-B6]
MLVDGRALLHDAYRRGYAVGSFNVSSLEGARAAIAAAEAERSPVMVQVWAGLFALGRLEMEAIAAGIRALARHAPVPVCLHLDHGEDVELVMAACDAGFTSVMIDASRFPWDQNVAMTQAVVAKAHAMGISVEAELGRIGGEEAGSHEDSGVAGGGTDSAGDEADGLTDPQEAAAFVRATGCDSLAVAVGTRHGAYRSAPQLALDRLAAINAVAGVPLVLHGGSYTPDDQVVAAIARGVAKVNVATELNDAWIDAVLARAAQGPRPRFADELTDPGWQAVTERIRAKMRLFGSSGKAG